MDIVEVVNRLLLDFKIPEGWVDRAGRHSIGLAAEKGGH